MSYGGGHAGKRGRNLQWRPPIPSMPQSGSVIEKRERLERELIEAKLRLKLVEQRKDAASTDSKASAGASSSANASTGAASASTGAGRLVRKGAFKLERKMSSTPHRKLVNTAHTSESPRALMQRRLEAAQRRLKGVAKSKRGSQTAIAQAVGTSSDAAYVRHGRSIVRVGSGAAPGRVGDKTAATGLACHVSGAVSRRETAGTQTSDAGARSAPPQKRTVALGVRGIARGRSRCIFPIFLHAASVACSKP